MQMPELQLELAGAGDEDEEIRREAERELDALGRKTDTWLAIFQVCCVSVSVLVSVSLTVLCLSDRLSLSLSLTDTWLASCYLPGLCVCLCLCLCLWVFAVCESVSVLCYVRAQKGRNVVAVNFIIIA